MHETQIVSCCVHHSDYDDLDGVYHKMNNVGESFDQAGAETIGGNRE
jgi:pentatricopeptide repeat protein